ncbi:hypothetical protein KKF34_04535 [Myxococcota bacterium]|nr:hypothetical protein [Myxococcota bacterium]MBU1380821.1 hypothetical protein [Myxococcota bacterium]MBU1496126.1 hypothetical protein [Myxococcota bacterium]
MNLNLSYFHPGQKAENSLKVINAAKAKWPSDVVVQHLASLVEKAAGELISAYTEWSTKEYTFMVQNADVERDNAIRYFIGVLRTQLYNESPENVAKAESLLLNLFPNNLDIVSYSYPEESIHIKNMLDLCNNFTADLTALGLTEAVERVRTKQAAFEEVYQGRGEHRNAKPSKVMDHLKPLDKSIRSLHLYLENVYDENEIRTVFDALLRLSETRRPSNPTDPTPET